MKKRKKNISNEIVYERNSVSKSKITHLNDKNIYLKTYVQIIVKQNNIKWKRNRTIFLTIHIENYI